MLVKLINGQLSWKSLARGERMSGPHSAHCRLTDARAGTGVSGRVCAALEVGRGGDHEDLAAHRFCNAARDDVCGELGGCDTSNVMRVVESPG